MSPTRSGCSWDPWLAGSSELRALGTLWVPSSPSSLGLAHPECPQRPPPRVWAVRFPIWTPAQTSPCSPGLASVPGRLAVLKAASGIHLTPDPRP